VSNLTYTVPDAPGRHTDCPLCGQAMRVQLHTDRLDANCYGGCDPEPALGALGEYDRGRLFVELRNELRKLPAVSHTGAPEPAPAPLPEFPVDALPAALADWVRATATATQTPLDLAAGMALAALSTVALAAATVRCAPGWEEELALWIVCVLPSGERKSAVLRSALEPVRELERERIAEARPAVARKAAEREGLEAQRKSLVRKVGDGKADPSELADVAERLEAAEEPVLPRLLADDATPEALGGLLARHGSIGVLAAESALLDNLAGRYADGRANLHLACQSYSGESARIDRRGREPEHLERPLLALGLCVQPHVLRRVAANETMREQGFLARGAFLLPSSNVGSRDTDPPSVPFGTVAAYHECVRSVGSVGCVGMSQGFTLKFTDEATEDFRTWREAHEPRLDPLGGDLAPIATWAGRHPGRVARLAGLLHLAEHPPAEPITAETFAAAVAIGEHLAVHALAALADDPQAAVDERAVAWLARRGASTVTVRELHRGPVGGGHGSAQPAHGTAERLEREGHLRRLPDPPATAEGGRPPSPTYEVLSLTNPNGAGPVTAGE